MFQSVLRRLSDSQTAELEGGGTAESGFTLIELMVVLLIIAILLAIAIPTFLGVTSSANDRAAQSNLTNALTEAAAVYQSNNQSFVNIATILPSSAPEFSWIAGVPTAGSNQVSVEAVDAASGTVGTTTSDYQGIQLAVLSKNNSTCWWVVQLQATPAVITGDANPAFEIAASGATGGQTGATTAGTYYAKSTANDQTNCKATYPQLKTGGFTWYSSYSAAVAET